MTVRQPRSWTSAAVVGGAVVVLAILRPWTVQPIRTSSPEAFDAASFVASVWPDALREAETSAVEAATVIVPAGPDDPGPPSRTSLFLRGRGVVVDIDQTSRVGTLTVDLTDDQPAQVRIMAGPILRGTALRDALSFVRFGDFANQSEFAAVANALNDRVLDDVLAPIDVAGLAGLVVSFVGAATVDSASPSVPLDVVPVRLEIVDGGSP